MSIISGIPPAGQGGVPSSLRKKPADSTSFAKHFTAAQEPVTGRSKLKSRMGIGADAVRLQQAHQRPAAIKTAAAPAAPPAAQAAQANPGAPLLTPDGYPVALLFYGASGADAVAPPPQPPLPPPLPTSEDAYWALQPPAVRVLRDLHPEARSEKAQELLQKGYIIDYPIMVLGWGPLKTMLARHNAGYTWVPSFMQTVTQVIPGMNFPGVPPYDPSNPPPRSIPVTFDFARGTSDGPQITASYGVKLADVAAT
jgi:hypothetical protein